MAQERKIVKRLTLTEPVTAHGEEIIELAFRKPKGKDFKRISGESMENPFEMMLDFAARLADVPPSTMDELEAEDVTEVIVFVGPFMPGGQQISTMLSET